MIKIEELYFKYKTGEHILKNINLQINKGECIAIVGKNGSGKSSFAKLIAGIMKPTKGNIQIDEINTKDNKKYIDLRKKIGIVFQNPENQIIFNNIEDELSFALKNLQLEDSKKRINYALEKVNFKKDKIDEIDIDELSLGQKQRIAIASVLAVQPSYIVLDEPTTMIDSEGKQTIYNIIKSLKKAGYTIIYITNNTEEILLADKTIVLENGEIVEQISKEQLLNNADILRKHNLRVPTEITILEELKKNGIDLEINEINIDEIIQKIIEKVKK